MRTLLLGMTLSFSFSAFGFSSETFEMQGETWYLSGSRYSEVEDQDYYGPSVHIEDVKIINARTGDEYWIEGAPSYATSMVCAAWTAGEYPNGYNYGDYRTFLWFKSVIVVSHRGGPYEIVKSGDYRGAAAAQNLNCYKTNAVYLD